MSVSVPVSVTVLVSVPRPVSELVLVSVPVLLSVPVPVPETVSLSVSVSVSVSWYQYPRQRQCQCPCVPGHFRVSVNVYYHVHVQCAQHKMRPHAYVDLTHSIFIQFWPWKAPIMCKSPLLILDGISLPPDDILKPPCHGIHQVLQVHSVSRWFPESVNNLRYALRRGWAIKTFFIALSFCKYFCFRSFHPSLTAVYLSLLTPSILSYSDFVKSLANPMKSLRGFRKLSRRSTITRPWREWSFSRLSKAKYKKRRRPPPIREILTQRLPSPIWPPNWRMTGERM